MRNRSDEDNREKMRSDRCQHSLKELSNQNDTSTTLMLTLKFYQMHLICVVLILLSSLWADAFTAKLNRPWDKSSAATPYLNSQLMRLHVDSSNLMKDKGDGDDDDNDKVESQSFNITDKAIANKISDGKASITTNDNITDKMKPEGSIKACLPDLIAMTRPSNLPAVVLLHMLGSFLVIQDTPGTLFWKVFVSPGMLITLVALLLTSCTSMLVNDYYDYKLGHDSTKIYKPLPSQRVTLATVKNFLSSLYAISLLCVAMVPGAPARASVTLGLILTFWYTKHLKPKTWLKNVVCASLIALSPLTSGMATMGLLQNYSWQGVFPLIRVVSLLFIGILGREMTMDINDVEDDVKFGIQTVPAVFGRRFATKVGLTCSFGVVILALSGPLMELIQGSRTFHTIRRLLLLGVGSLGQLRRSYQVFQTEGQDSDVVHIAVEEGLLTVPLILAGFV